MHTLGKQLISKLSDNGLGFIDSDKGAVYNFKSPATESTAEGSPILIHSAEAPFTSFDIFGKSTQSGTPSPETPAEIVSAGQSGQIKVDITGEAGIEPQSLILATQDGLPGIPVSDDDYTYIDSTGQKWITDSIEYRRDGKCVRVQRIGKHEISYVSAITNVRQKNPDYFGCEHSGIKDELINRQVGILCNKNIFLGAEKNLNGSEMTYVSSNGFMVFGIPKKLVQEQTLEAVNNYLKENPFDIIYPLKQSIETPLTPEEIAAFKALHTNEPATTIVNDADAWMKVGYYTGAGIRRMVAEAVRINGERVR